MKKNIVTKSAATLLGVAMLSAPLAGLSEGALAKPPAVATKHTPHQNKSTKQAKQENTSQKRKEITAEALEAIRETENALRALDKKNKKKALAALERATGKLEIILARDPKLALAPVAVNRVVNDVISDVATVNKLKKQAIAALKEERLQEARHLINGLASETVISVTSLPLSTYPSAIKAAAKLIDADKVKEGKAMLETALSTLVVTDTVIPLPIITAQSLLSDAEKLAEKKKRSADENKQLEQALKLARKELQFAQALGYGSKKTFKGFYEEIDKISSKTSDGKSGRGFFANIKHHLKDALGFSQKK